ncbi:small integral membrane protein 20-like [Limulus polyphemus]|uniref:Small integral membrane protein 20-like n=1 Tax=Limulus polyphemus TaxID=6850 RepID=A0ABM1BZI8_LIMPO|nr:small integral membrane protein 20-like [Limulus polyphemus]
MANLSGWRYARFLGGIAGLIGLALYPIIVYPYFHVEEYKDIQKKTREGINQEAIQPGGMKVWTNPFEGKTKS